MADAELMSRVRTFNRFVTQRVGALHDHYLGRDYPLGQARLVWEIGEHGRDVRSLRAQLDLDSGYLSRMLRSLERAGLVEVGPADDRRVRTARLTSAGLVERAALDRISDAQAGSLLDPLTPRQRDRLVAAMADVERLLTAAMVTIAPADPATPEAQHCLRSYYAELDVRFEAGFDPARSSLPDEGELRPPRGLLLVAGLRGEPIGCGALLIHPDAPPIIKRMWVADAQRGLGVGRRLLAALEAAAADRGARTVRLETHRALAEAINLYRTSGYTEVPAFNDERYAHHWFVKPLDGPGSAAQATA